MKQYQSFEFLPHTADISMIARGKTYEELFAAALHGMFAVMQPQYRSHAPEITRSITAQGIDRDALLINFLSEVLCTAAIEHEAYTTIHFQQLTEHSVQAQVIGFPLEQYENAEIKAVTYHNFSLRQEHGIFQATITFDI